MTVVYWIFDQTCLDVADSGYVGVSENAYERLKAHLKTKRVPVDSKMKIIFEGTREECFSYELKLRPSKGTGWNRAVGGAHGWRVGFLHSEETKSKMRVAKINVKQTEEHIAKRVAATKGQKRPAQSRAISGSNNPTFGTKRPQHVIDAMRNARIGCPSFNRQEIYCVGCHQKVNRTTLKKYHNRCFMNFVHSLITVTKGDT